MSITPGIILADHHDLFRQSLKSLMEQSEKKFRLFEAVNGSEVLDIISRQSIQLLIMETRMPVLDGFEVIRLIRKNYPSVKIMIMCTYEEKAFVVTVLKHGIDGIIFKRSSSSREFIEAVEKILAGEKYFNDATIQLMRETDWMNLPQVEFSNRDVQILKLLDEGLISKQIAGMLNLTTNTVEFYRKRLLRKTQTRNSNDLIRYIKNIGVLP
ncbi:MAG TPA: response regulator transcription factor [Chryseosolibacter sp.]|nr:response regulator transcription factor [Chryseosolibacter sp.]